jgi:hypothetical protein
MEELLAKLPGIAALTASMRVEWGVKFRPLLLTENHDGNFTACKILLVTHVLIRGHKQIKPASSAAVIKSPFLSLSHPC